MDEQPDERRIDGATDRMDIVDRAVGVHVHAVEAEGDDERPHGAHVAVRQPALGRRSDEDVVRELAEHDDGEGGVAVVLVVDIDGRGKLQPEHLRAGRAEAGQVGELLPQNGDHGHADLRSIADALEVDRSPQADGDESQRGVDPVLRAMVVARNAVHEEEAELGEADALVGRDGRSLRFEALADVVGVVAVQHEERHDPEDAASLEQVVVIVVVGVLLRVGPRMPGGREDEYEDDETGAAGLFR